MAIAMEIAMMAVYGLIGIAISIAIDIE